MTARTYPYDEVKKDASQRIVPYYVKNSARAISGVRGLFLAGIASASISTVSSVVNSNAAVLFVDIVSPNFHVPQAKTALVMAGLAAASGTVMTIVGLLVPYIGSAARFLITLSAAASGPFAGIVILAFLFPWANTKGTATAALGVFLIQTWQTTGRFMARIEPLRMNYGTDRCPGNSTYHDVPQHEDRPYSDVFPLYRLSAYWCCLFSTILTVLLGLIFSILSVIAEARWGAASPTHEVHAHDLTSAPLRPTSEFSRHKRLLLCPSDQLLSAGSAFVSATSSSLLRFFIMSTERKRVKEP
ncbi:sodium-dependent multivitamin transporter-like [Dermacentor variabilis]|uniref:sodium-dependent multivitamin transporter-like n=1 Tax=Dermacentor variabilis TaxID=34621 RepID=UPI003F5B2D8D